MCEIEKKKLRTVIIKNKKRLLNIQSLPSEGFDSRYGSVSHGVLRRLQGRGQRAHMYTSAAFKWRELSKVARSRLMVQPRRRV